MEKIWTETKGIVYYLNLNLVHTIYVWHLWFLRKIWFYVQRILLSTFFQKIGKMFVKECFRCYCHFSTFLSNLISKHSFCSQNLR